MGTKTPIDGVIFWDLMAAIVLSVLAFGTVEPWSLAIFQFNTIILAGLLALRPVIDPGIRLTGLRLLLPFAAFFLLALIQFVPFGAPVQTTSPETVSIAELASRTLSLDPYATREAAFKILALLVCFCAALQVMHLPERRRTAIVIFSIFGFAVSLFAIVQRLTYAGKMYWIRTITPYAAPFGPYGNYNHFAGLIELLLPIPLAWALLARIDGEKRSLWFISVIVMAAAAILTLSRSGTLILTIQIALLVLLLHRTGSIGSIRKVLLPALLIIGAGLLAFWIGGDSLTTRFGMLGRQEHSVATRLEYWSSSWRIFTDHPVTGIGIGAFPAVYPSYGTSSAKYERLEQTHNDYLQLLTDAGLIGALIAFWFLFEAARAVRANWRAFDSMRNRDRAWLIGGIVSLTGILLHSAVDFNLQIAANSLLTLFILGVISVESTKYKV